jgi:hypothetical protein
MQDRDLHCRKDGVTGKTGVERRGQVLTCASSKRPFLDMVRPLRLEFAGALYHVTSRGLRKAAYFLEFARYVVLNPLRARMVRSPGDYPWRSYRAMIGEEAAPEWLERRATLAAFGQAEAQAIEGYRAFVAAGQGQPSPWGLPQAAGLSRLGDLRPVDATQSARRA